MFPDVTQLNQTVEINTAVQRQLLELIVKLNATLDAAVKELKEINRPWPPHGAGPL